VNMDTEIIVQIENMDTEIISLIENNETIIAEMSPDTIFGVTTVAAVRLDAVIPSGIWTPLSTMFVPAGVSYAFARCRLSFSQNPIGVRSLEIVKNGVYYQGGIAKGGTAHPVSATKIKAQTPEFPVVSGDFFTLSAYQDSGTDLNIGSNGLSIFTVETT